MQHLINFFTIGVFTGGMRRELRRYDARINGTFSGPRLSPDGDGSGILDVHGRYVVDEVCENHPCNGRLGASIIRWPTAPAGGRVRRPIGVFPLVRQANKVCACSLRLDVNVDHLSDPS